MQKGGLEFASFFSTSTIEHSTSMHAITRGDKPPGTTKTCFTESTIKTNQFSSFLIPSNGHDCNKQFNTVVPNYHTSTDHRYQHHNMLHTNKFLGQNSQKDNLAAAGSPFIEAGLHNSNAHFLSSSKKLSTTLPSTGTEDVQSPDVTKRQQVERPTLKGVYDKMCYAVLIGSTVRVCNTKLYASLPQQNKYMVKEQMKDQYGATRVKLVLKSSNERYMLNGSYV